jgi:hypothetical protein
MLNSTNTAAKAPVISDTRGDPGRLEDLGPAGDHTPLIKQERKLPYLAQEPVAIMHDGVQKLRWMSMENLGG